MNLSELRKITAFCRKNGILKFRNEQFEFVLSRQALKLPRSRVKEAKIDISKLSLMPNGMTEDQLLTWSAPDFKESLSA